MADVFRAPTIARPESIDRPRPAFDDAPNMLLTNLSAPAGEFPFLQSDWPNPRRPRLGAYDAGEMSSRLSVGLPAEAGFPFTEHDWPIPRGRRYPVTPLAGDVPTSWAAFCWDSAPGSSTFFQSGAAASTFFEVVSASGTMAGASSFFQSGAASSTFFVRPC